MGTSDVTVMSIKAANQQHVSMHDGLELCLLTETGDAGSSPHVARWFFQWYSMTKNIAIYIYIYN